MIKVVIEKDKIDVKGHANYDEFGKDIVCASVSTLVISTINNIIDIDEESILYEEKDNEIKIEIKKDNKIVRKLIDNMVLMLEDLEKDYPKNIKILRR